MGVIAQSYNFASKSSDATTVSFFPAARAGDRIILLVASYNMPTVTTSGYVKHAAADGFDHAHIYSKVAAGGETSVTVTRGALNDGMILYVQVRDDCPEVLFATSGDAAAGATSISCSPVDVPAAVGVVLGVLERFRDSANGIEGRVSPNAWTPAIADISSSSGGFSSTLNGAQFYAGALPSPGRVTYRESLSGAGQAQAAFVGFGISDMVKPSVPPGLHTTDVQDTTVTIAWEPASDDRAVTGYGIYLNGAKRGGDQTARTYTFTGLTKGTTYEIGVDARDSAGNRSERSTISVMAITDLAAPTAPGNVRLADLAHTTATIAWDAASDDVALAGYGVYLDGLKQGDDQPELEHTFLGLGRGRAYAVGVDAVDTAGNRSPIATLDFTTLADTLPGTPPGLTATAGVEEVALAWQPASDDLGIARYEVLLDGEVTAATATLGYVVEGLDPGSVYTVGVRAVDDGGGRGPIVETEVTTLLADWSPRATPIYRLGPWTGNARDAHGVDWVVESEEGWSSTADVLPLEAESDSTDGGFSGPGSFGARLITLEGTAVATSRAGMLAAQERLAAALYPGQLGTLRVQEQHLTRQARVRLAEEVEITDKGSVAFSWVISLMAPDPRRTAVRPIYAETAVETLPGSASAHIYMTGDYRWIPARIQVWGPIRDFVITHEESGLVIRSRPGTVLPADSRYSLDIDLATRVVLAHVPPEVWPEPRPGRIMLGSFPARFALSHGPNTLTLAGQPVDGQVGSPRMVVQAWDAWR
ncbi:fibronectin type III domain-containing protein [Planomonospora sp. ID82291]|uniref:fibronectin type III domain-containing protein n=1 Tax=Planomonospora sp. ID82291 TaxID=2738136 RepID=UPI0018C427F7|nr:fibronectin type III domain-containing protein [Planomonospora sp. ID82291]MBG0819023.1 fibronectin type III domain-containing protein [Planomonospora sp. ID82291]